MATCYGYNAIVLTRSLRTLKYLKTISDMKVLSDNIKAVLSLIIVIMGIAYFFMCAIRDIKPDPQITIAMVGFIGAVTGYHFGASSSSNKPLVTQTGDNPTVQSK